MNLKNILWALSEKLITIALTLLTTGLIARYFGVELFGAYQYAMSILFIVTAFTWLCPAEILFSQVNEKGQIDNKVVVTSIIYRFFISLMTYVGVILYVFGFVEDHNQLAFILILTITILYAEPLGIFRFLLECQGFYHLTAKIRLLSLIIKVCIITFIIYVENEPLIIMCAIVLEGALVALFCYLTIRSKDLALNLNFGYFDTKIVKLFFVHGIKLWFGLVCMNAFLKIDRILLEEYLSPAIFGSYTAAFSVLEQLTSLSVMILAVLGPTMIYRASGNLLHSNTLKLATIMGFLGLSGAVVMFYLSEYFIPMVYGNSFSDSILMFKYIFTSLKFIKISFC
jgi:O-antigen/teichoic acid export membrane protein